MIMKFGFTKLMEGDTTGQELGEIKILMQAKKSGNFLKSILIKQVDL